jgi:Rha family phage regulatory protein
VAGRAVADCFGKRHDNVQRDIDSLISTDPNLDGSSHFQGGDYIDLKGETQRQFTMTRDGFMLLAMGFTGSEAVRWAGGQHGGRPGAPASHTGQPIASKGDGNGRDDR